MLQISHYQYSQVRFSKNIYIKPASCKKHQRMFKIYFFVILNLYDMNQLSGMHGWIWHRKVIEYFIFSSQFLVLMTDLFIFMDYAITMNVFQRKW